MVIGFRVVFCFGSNLDCGVLVVVLFLFEVLGMGLLGWFFRLDDFFFERICGFDGGFGIEDDWRFWFLSGDDRVGLVSDFRWGNFVGDGCEEVGLVILMVDENWVDWNIWDGESSWESFCWNGLCGVVGVFGGWGDDKMGWWDVCLGRWFVL